MDSSKHRDNDKLEHDDNDACKNVTLRRFFLLIYLERGPIHSHGNTMIVGPPFQILCSIGIIYSMLVFFIDLRNSAQIMRVKF